ncbi:MAG: helicase C-terminal domain-containing protein [Phormidesmis sp.]
MIETEVHQRLRAYMREQGHSPWPHHLTMARLVARALRVGRSALMQTDSLAAYQGTYRLSYLIPVLLWPEPAILALPEGILETVVRQDIPDLQQRLPVIKPVQMGDRWPGENFRGLLITSAQGWLQARLSPSETSHFPAGIPTLIDGAGDLERWARQEMQIVLSTADWDALMLAYPSQRTFIRDMRVRITHAVFQHPANPYSCHLIEDPEKTLLEELFALLDMQQGFACLPPQWHSFWQQFQLADRLAWSQLDRSSGTVSLCCGPTDVARRLAPVWAQQPIVLMGAALDAEKQADKYRARLGLGEMTCLNFGPDRHNDLIHLYLPDRLPMPNTSHFQPAVMQEVRSLLTRSTTNASTGSTVILVGDMPLKAQMATLLAAEFGSRVQVESPIGPQGILIAGWDYWHRHQTEFAVPDLLIITTLPIPSLENPVVAGRVASYKRRRQDWFKAYLLPAALSELQHAVAPVRSRQGIVALLDNRVNHRSYGRQVISALSPAARSTHLNVEWFEAAPHTAGYL